MWTLKMSEREAFIMASLLLSPSVILASSVKIVIVEDHPRPPLCSTHTYQHPLPDSLTPTPLVRVH